MDREDLIRMAREAGLHRQQHNLTSNPMQYRFSYDGHEENLEAFAALVASAEHERIEHAAIGSVRAAILYEREACAKLCEQDDSMRWSGAANAIRARGQA